MPEKVRSLARYLAEHEIWLVGFAVALSIFSARFQALAILILVGVRAAQRLSAGSFSKRTPVDAGVFFLLLAAGISLWVTPFAEVTRLQVARLVIGVGLFYSIVNWAWSQERLKMLIIGLSAAGTGLSLLAPVSVRWVAGRIPIIPASIYENFTLLLADTIHRNVMAGTLVLLAPLPAAMLFFSWKALSRTGRWLAGITAALMAVVVILTQSRGGWMALAAAAGIILLARGRRARILLGFLVVGGVIAVVSTGIPDFLEVMSADETLGGFQERADIWSSAAAMIKDFPFTGIGMGGFGVVADRLYPFFRSAPETIPHAHNLVLQVGVDLGIPGLVAWLSIVIGTIYASWRVIVDNRAREGSYVASFGAGVLASQGAMLVHGLVDAVTWGMVRPAPLVWGLWGIALAANLVRARRGEEDPLPEELI